MAYVSINSIIRNLQHNAGLSFFNPFEPRVIDVGPNETEKYGGLGLGVTFNVHGSHYTSSGVFIADYMANAHLDLTRPLSFMGSVTLGDLADVRLEGIGATSYSYDGHHLKLYAGGTPDANGHPTIGGYQIDDLTLNTGGRPLNVASFSATGPVLVSTGAFSPGEGYAWGIYPHA